MHDSVKVQEFSCDTYIMFAMNYLVNQINVLKFYVNTLDYLFIDNKT